MPSKPIWFTEAQWGYIETKLGKSPSTTAIKTLIRECHPDFPAEETQGGKRERAGRKKKGE